MSFWKKSIPAADPANRVLERRVTVSTWVLGFERIWRAAFWPMCVVGVFLVATLFGLWAWLPRWAHIAGLAALALAFIVSLAPLFRLRAPTREEALRRLERASGVPHRPATSYEDTLAPGASAPAAALWQAHRERLARNFRRLKVSGPRPKLYTRDPLALRAALVLVLLIALLASGGQTWERLRAAVVPPPAGATKPMRLDAWVKPPIYTRKPAIVLADGIDPSGSNENAFRALSVPEKSTFVARVNSANAERVTLAFQPEGGADAKPVPLKDDDSADDVHDFELQLSRPGALEVALDGTTAAKWHVKLIDDEDPQIALTKDPAETARHALQLNYKVKDDYGVASAQAHFELAEKSATPDGFSGSSFGVGRPAQDEGKTGDSLSKPPVVPLTLPGSNPKEAEGRAYRDLTAHPWAGLMVRMTLTARDQAGQTGSSKPVVFRLPARKFNDPLARAIIEQRRKLVRDANLRDEVAQALDALSQKPERFIKDKTNFLMLRDAYWRLENDRSPAARTDVVDQLWALALRIEDGDLPQAERDLHAAQDKLMDALSKKDISDKDIDKRIKELRQALDKFLQNLAKRDQQTGRKGDQAKQQQQNNREISAQQLDKILKHIANLAKSGSKDMAQKMLSELQDMLERLQTGNTQQNAQAKKTMETVEKLSKLIQKQQKLLDDTFEAERNQSGGDKSQSQQMNEERPNGAQPGQQPFSPQFGQQPGMVTPGEASPWNDTPRPRQGGSQRPGGQGMQGQNGQPQQGQSPGRGRGQGSPQSRGQGQGQRPGPGYGKLASRQEGIRKELDALMQQMRGKAGPSGKKLQDAGQAMGDARTALSESNLARAGEHETMALDKLRKGTQAMAEQGLKAMGQQMGQGRGGPRDPLGRPERTRGPDLGLTVKVPDQIDVQRAREILDELRNRLSNPNRPQVEQDYLERLIKQY